MSDRVFLIGLDGATWRLLEPWVESEELPTVSRFIEQGVHGTLRSTIPSKTCPAVPTLYTGRDPAQLGLFDFLKPDGTTVSSNDVEDPKIWSVLNQHGVKSCIVNLRVTYPPDPLDGVMITGFPTPGEESPYTFPADLKDRVRGFQFDDEEAELRHLTREPYEHAGRILELRKRILKTRWEVFRELTTEEKYGLNVFWIGGTDFLQHWLWEDPQTLLSFYEEIDRLLAELTADVNSPVFVVSDHGFEPKATERIHVNEWLRRNGWLKVYGGTLGNRMLGRVQGLIRQYVPPRYLQRTLKLFSSLTRDGATRDGSAVDRTIKNVPGISPDSDAVLATRWGIDVNVDQMRYRDVCQEIIEGLRSLQRPEGGRAMKGVWHRNEVFSRGKYIEEIPDIVFQPQTGLYPEAQLSTSLISKRIGRMGSRDGRMFNAEHEGDRNGILLALGESIASEEECEADIQDIAPTLLHLLDVSIPDIMSGSVLNRVFRSGSEPFRRTPRFESYSVFKTRDRDGLSADDHAGLEERLEDMGYL